MKIENIMSRNVITVKEETSIDELIRLLVEHEITGVPVVSEELNVLGVITEKDILSSLYYNRPVFIPELMTRDVVCFDIDSEVIEVAECLMENNFRRIPILSKGKLVGIVSRSDVIKLLYNGKK